MEQISVTSFLVTTPLSRQLPYMTSCALEARFRLLRTA